MAARGHNVLGPYQGQSVRRTSEPLERARAAILMGYGRGARS